MSNVKDSVDSHQSLLTKQNATSKSLSILKKYFFIIGIICSVTMAALYPHIGCNDCIAHPKITSSWITVILIFLLRGISMKTSALKKATLFFGLNIFTHAFIFIYVPSIAYLVFLICRNNTLFSDELLDGLLILSALPTTTVTCVVLTATAEGNEAAAIVNATVANLTGIIISPTVVLILLGSSANVDILDTFSKLAMKIMVPFCVGQIFRICVGDKGRKWITNKKQYCKKCIEICLFYIIFCAISESFKTGFAADVIEVFYMLLVIIALHCMLLVMNWYLTMTYSKIANNCCCKPFDISDRIAILFCATQKTAAMGLPMIETMFGNDSNMAMYIIPLLLYHPFQLIFDSLLVHPISNWRLKEEQKQQLLANEDVGSDYDERSMTSLSLKSVKYNMLSADLDINV